MNDLIALVGCLLALCGSFALLLNTKSPPYTRHRFKLWQVGPRVKLRLGCCHLVTVAGWPLPGESYMSISELSHVTDNDGEIRVSIGLQQQTPYVELLEENR